MFRFAYESECYINVKFYLFVVVVIFISFSVSFQTVQTTTWACVGVISHKNNKLIIHGDWENISEKRLKLTTFFSILIMHHNSKKNKTLNFFFYSQKSCKTDRNKFDLENKGIVFSICRVSIV